MNPLVLFSGGVATGNFGPLSSAVQMCASRPEFLALGCAQTLPFLRYGESPPHTLSPSSQVVDVNGTVLFDSWANAQTLTPGVGRLEGPFWFGDPLNCEEWTNPQSCGGGVVVSSDYTKSVSACGELHRVYCVCA